MPADFSIRLSPSTAAAASVRRLLGLGSWAIALCALGLMASAAHGIEMVGGAAPSDLPAQHGFPQATYYRVSRVDMRLCPSPLCGGVFVERVNRRKARCADGTLAEECHVVDVDFSALGLTSAEESQLEADFFARRVLARGDLELVDVGIGLELPTLFVKDAWRGVTGTQSDYGQYFGVVSTGIVCITFPCPSFAAFKLNGRRISWLHGIDLQSSGATAEEIGRGTDALSSGPGLIGFGSLRRIVGPAGNGKELRTSEFYLRVEGARPPACGGFTYPPNPACDAGDFCEQPAGSCFIADLPGTCQEIPEACIAVIDPVCGCDGVTYGNDCERRRAQIALDHAGACEF